MNIIPAIDLKDGNCVRLYKGDFGMVTEYSSDPEAVARRLSELAVSDLHIVDLDGALTGAATNRKTVQCIAAATSLNVQLGGGIRTKSQLATWLESGVTRCVIGSVAIKDPAAVSHWLTEFGPERIVLALDIKLDAANCPYLTTDGWTKASKTTLWECLDAYQDYGAVHVLCTDVDRDGAMSGPNIELYQELIRRYPGIELQASGGVRDIDDLVRLRHEKIPSAICGRAILDGAIRPEEIAQFQQNA